MDAPLGKLHVVPTLAPIKPIVPLYEHRCDDIYIYSANKTTASLSAHEPALCYHLGHLQLIRV